MGVPILHGNTYLVVKPRVVRVDVKSKIIAF